MSSTCTVAVSVEQRLQEVSVLCESRGKRLTQLRAQVLRLLLEHGQSLKAYELLVRMQATHPSAKPATVYRALDFLVEEGLIHRLDAINGWTACQHLLCEHDTHDFLVVCTRCGAVQELSAPTVRTQLQSLLTSIGYKADSPDVEIRACCPQCLSDDE